MVYEKTYIDISLLLKVVDAIQKLKGIGVEKVGGTRLPIIRMSKGRTGIRTDKLKLDKGSMTFVELPNLSDVFIVIYNKEE
jgi:hypothetical protein